MKHRTYKIPKVCGRCTWFRVWRNSGKPGAALFCPHCDTPRLIVSDGQLRHCPACTRGYIRLSVLYRVHYGIQPAFTARCWDRTAFNQWRTPHLNTEPMERLR